MELFGKSEPESATVKGIPLRCEICKNDRFWPQRAQLQSAVASFFNLDWTGRTADCLVCSNCGYIHWFLDI
jgi:hypothetical protein